MARRGSMPVMSAGPIPQNMRRMPLQKMPVMSDNDGDEPVKVKKGPPPKFGHKKGKAY